MGKEPNRHSEVIKLSSRFRRGWQWCAYTAQASNTWLSPRPPPFLIFYYSDFVFSRVSWSQWVCMPIYAPVAVWTLQSSSSWCWATKLAMPRGFTIIAWTWESALGFNDSEPCPSFSVYSLSKGFLGWSKEMVYVKMALENIQITEPGCLYSLKISLPKYLLITMEVLASVHRCVVLLLPGGRT